MGKDLNGKEIGNGIFQRKDGMYVGRFVDRFGKRRTLYNKKIKELKNSLNSAIYEDKNNMNIIDNKITLDEWFKKWLDIHKFNVIRESTRNTYQIIYNKHIKPELGEYKIQDISHIKIKRLINDLHNKGYGYTTKHRVKIVLSDMFNKALIDDLIVKNPAKGIPIEKDTEKNIRVLSIDEQNEFFNTCKNTFYDNFFIVLISTGLRIGEITSLTESDLDFNKKTIKITKTLLYQKIEDSGDNKKTFHLHEPKTNSSRREIPMNKHCEEALLRQLNQKKVVERKSPKKVNDEFKDLIFTTKFNTPINAQIVIDSIKNIVNEINLKKDPLEEIEYFSSHCFRHTFATRCFEAGIQAKTVQAYLGHASLKMTMDLYTTVMEDYQQEEMKKLEDNMNDIFNY